jgi:gamma-glutamyltranspeptidase/glutathione hydrolase
MAELHSAGHRRGVVAAPHALAAEAGRHILAEGGNALEAMLAMAAAIAAVYPHMNHVGGDGFWLIREPSGRLRALMGAGPAGAKATPQLYRDHGHDAIPARGPLAALTVPAAVAAWMLALEAARAHGGRLPLDVLLAPAIRHAREGYGVTRSQARLTAEKLPELQDVPGFAAAFLLDGKAPEAGATLRQQALAATIAAMSDARSPPTWSGSAVR